MSYIVALTGGIGSGKTTVANLFAQLGVPIVDADVIARDVVEPGTPALNQIAEHFGSAVINRDGTLNRRSLREIVFANPVEKQWLNKLLHPLIQVHTQRLFSQCQAPYLIWVMPLLIENNLVTDANRILVVDVSREKQIQRTMQRDNASQQSVENILAAQVTREVRLAHADDIINNEASLEQIHEQVNQLHQLYLQLAQQNHNANQ